MGFEREISGTISQWSHEAAKAVKNPIGDPVTPAISVMFMLNSMTGVSVLTLPYAFSKAGLWLGALVVFVCMAVGFVTGTFMCEAFSIACAIRFEQVRSLMVDDMNSPTVPQAKRYRIRERMEIGYLGELLLNNKLFSGLVYLVVVLHMYGANTVLVVLVNKALSHATVSVMSMFGGFADESMVYRVCLIVTLCVIFPLCLRDLQRTKKFTLYLMVFKFTAISLFMIVSTVKAVERVQAEGASAVFSAIPTWNMDYVALVFGNAVFLFCQHHMLPSMVAPVQPQDKIPHVIGVSFILISLFSCAVNATALLAWSQETEADCSATAGGNYCIVQPMYNLNFAPLDWFGGALGIFIVAYPAMSLANFPVQAITTRNTLNLLFGFEPLDAAKPFTVQNLGLLLAVWIPPYAVAFITTDVQTLIQYFGGYTGLTIAFLFPMALMLGGRRKFGLSRCGGNDEARPLQSYFGNVGGYCLVALFYVVALGMVTQKLFFTP